MPSLGSFIVGTPARATGSSGGGGEPEPTIVHITSGTSQEFADRAGENPYLAVTVIDPTTVSVLVSLPAEMDQDEFTSFTEAMMFAFSGEIPFGWFSITAKGVVGLADSSDQGSTPDYIPVVGTVTLFPSFTRPIKITSTNQFFTVAASTAIFDSDGELSYDGQKGIRLISPQWSDLSDNAWTWTAQVRPGPGQNWEGFDVTFTAAPGASVDLVDFL